MGTNDPAYMREYHKKHYAANKQKYIDQTATRRRQLKEEIWAIKSVPCADCGIQYDPWVMQFDHRKDENKEYEISKLISRYNKTKLFKEINKCDIVCANCHANRTYQRLIGVSG